MGTIRSRRSLGRGGWENNARQRLNRPVLDRAGNLLISSATFSLIAQPCFACTLPLCPARKSSESVRRREPKNQYGSLGQEASWAGNAVEPRLATAATWNRA